MAEKQNLNVVFVGHVDHGKSTAVGRLLYDSGKLPETELKKAKDVAEKLGKKGFEFAFIMDHLKEERERGVTIDLAYKKFPTNKWNVTIIDAPGHRDFVKNMITGTSQADAAILVIAAPEGVMAQTKEHAWLCRTMGVNQLAVLINKMDVINYDEAKYKKVKEEVSIILKTAGYKIDDMHFIPASAYNGDNIAKKGDKMAWFKGPTLMEVFDKFEMPEPPTDLPLRMPIQDVYEITGVGTVPVGKIETGIMKNGMKVIVLPARSGKGIEGEIRTIEMHHENLPQAQAGDNVGISIRGVGKKDIARGDVICDAAKPPKVIKQFTAKVAVINHPTVIAKGYTPVFHIHTAQVPCRFDELSKKFDPKTGAVIQENPDFLKTGDVAEAKITPLKPVVLEKQSDNPHLSGFAIRDAGATVAAGVCIDYTEK